MAARVVKGALARPENRIHVQLRGLPRTATPGDVRRVLASAKLENIDRVEIDYRRFEPRGVTWIKLTTAAQSQFCAKTLNEHTFAGRPLKANVSPPPELFARRRGQKGRSDAAERGLIVGDGPSGGVSSNGKAVAITGLPGRMNADAVKDWLRNFKLAEKAGEDKEVVQIELPAGDFSTISKHLVRLGSVSEAHRLVRKLHQTYYMPEKHGELYPLRCRLIY